VKSICAPRYQISIVLFHSSGHRDFRHCSPCRQSIRINTGGRVETSPTLGLCFFRGGVGEEKNSSMVSNLHTSLPSFTAKMSRRYYRNRVSRQDRYRAFEDGVACVESPPLFAILEGEEEAAVASHIYCSIGPAAGEWAQPPVWNSQSFLPSLMAYTRPSSLPA